MTSLAPAVLLTSPWRKGMGGVWILSNLRYNEGNEIAVGGARWRRQTLGEGVNEAETARLRALLHQAAVVPSPSPLD